MVKKSKRLFNIAFFEGIGKKLWNEQTEPKRRLWATRRRTMVRRADQFVRSKKRLIFHKIEKSGFYTLILYTFDGCFVDNYRILFFSCVPEFFNIPHFVEKS